MAKNRKADNQVSAVRRAKHGWILTVFFSHPCGIVSVPDFSRG